MLSSSPGFVSQFLDDGRAEWATASGITLGVAGDDEVGAVDWEGIAAMRYNEKYSWFLKQMAQLQVPWEEGHVHLRVRRRSVLADTFQQLRALAEGKLHQWMRVEFEGERALDAGGLKREWLHLCVSALFEAEQGLFESTSSTDEQGYTINPCSADFHGDHLEYYHVAGRVLGKAIMEQQPVTAHLALPLLKHILGVPITFSDLEFVDGQLYKNLLWLSGANAAEVEAMSIDFTVSHFGNGKMRVVELCPGGKDREVTQENKDEYIQLKLRHRMLDSIAPQLFQLLNGLFQVVPRELLTVFDYQELEMVLCGLPVIDVTDWMKHTGYSGAYQTLRGKHPVIGWFWDIVRGYEQDGKARLLQFATGTSRVPAQGFRALQSNDGKPKLFSLNGVSTAVSMYPRAHTCFNRIDLPLYSTREELEGFLSLAINMEVTGFTME
jgi:hypothetical protein